jgi:hypothetical protein
MADLAAGVELDRVIAQRVFGWELLNDTALGNPWRVPGGDPYSGQYSYTSLTPPYSTDMAAALAVFERMVARAGSGHIEASMDYTGGEDLIAWVSFGNAAGAAGALPWAVCIAALHSLDT